MSGLLKDRLDAFEALLSPLRAQTAEPRLLRRAVAAAGSGGGSTPTTEDIPALQARIVAAAKDAKLREFTARDIRQGCSTFMSAPTPPGRDADVATGWLREVERRRRRGNVFLLVSAYLDGFATDDEAVARLGNWLSSRAQPWGWRVDSPWPGRAERYRLFNSHEAPGRIAAAVMRSKDSPDAVLDLAGLDSEGRRRGGLAQAAFGAACLQVASAPPAEAMALQERLTGWAVDRSGALAMPELWPNLVNALLAPWSSHEPPNPHKQKLVTLLERFGGGDPRMKPGRWSAVLTQFPEAYATLLRWLTQASVLQFFDVVDRTADPYMWKFRRAFWTSYLLAGCIDQAWVVFNSNGADLARAQMRRAGDNRDEAFATFRERAKSPDHAALIMKIGDLVIADWSHIGCYNIWTKGQKNAPALFSASYLKDQLDSAPIRGSHTNSPYYTWQSAVARIIKDETGCSTPMSSWAPDRVR